MKQTTRTPPAQCPTLSDAKDLIFKICNHPKLEESDKKLVLRIRNNLKYNPTEFADKYEELSRIYEELKKYDHHEATRNYFIKQKIISDDETAKELERQKNTTEKYRNPFAYKTMW